MNKLKNIKALAILNDPTIRNGNNIMKNVTTLNTQVHVDNPVMPVTIAINNVTLKTNTAIKQMYIVDIVFLKNSKIASLASSVLLKRM